MKTITEKILKPKEVRELYFNEVLQMVDREIDRLKNTSNKQLTALQKASMIMHKVKKLENKPY